MPAKTKQAAKWSSQADSSNMKSSCGPPKYSSQRHGQDSTQGHNRGRGRGGGRWRGRFRGRGNGSREFAQHPSDGDDQLVTDNAQQGAAQPLTQPRPMPRQSVSKRTTNDSSNPVSDETTRPFSQPMLDSIRPVLFPPPSQNFGKPHDRPFPFLRLPPELRNKIYELLFIDRRITVKKRRRTRSEVENKVPNAYTGLVHTQIIGRKKYQGGIKELTYPFALVLTCRQIHDEIFPYMYSETKFWFGSQKPIRRFLEFVPQRALGCIRHLELYHNTYGEPLETINRRYKERDDDSWMDVCIGLSKKLTGLKTLQIDYRICDWPVQPTPDSDWAQPILELGKGKFEEVKIRLIHPCLDAERLTVCAKSMAKFLLSETGNKQRIAHEAIEKQRREERELFSKALNDWLQHEENAMKAAARHDQREAEARRIKSMRITNTANSKRSPSKYKNTVNGRYEGGYALQGLGEPPNPYGPDALRVSKWENGRYVTKYVPFNNSGW